MRAIHEFHWQGKWPSSCNVSSITIIPKVDNPQDLKGYRPISLVGSIISKLLANRIKKVVTKVVDKTQSAFLAGRNLLENVLLQMKL